jgi:hypothetical protein
MAKDDKPLNPEVIPPSSAPANRVRAHRIRSALRSGKEVSPEDRDWIRAYSENRGSSRKHTVEYREESAEAEGTGTAAEVAAAMAAPELAREEGRRYDFLIGASINAINASAKATDASNQMILKMAEQILKRNEQMENVHLKQLETIGVMSMQLANAEAESIIKDAEADAEAKAAESGGDEISNMVREMLPALLNEARRRMTDKSPK